MASRQLQSKPGPTSKAKVFLMWVKQVSPVYGQLSTNVLREVCQFLAAHALLAIRLWREMNVLLFDPLALQFRVLDYSKQRLPQTIDSECVCIGYDQVFLCGGIIIQDKPRGKTGIAIVINSKRAKQLPDMKTKRCEHGLYFHEDERRVFVFGGYNTLNKGIKNCEQYSFAKGSWAPLPDMTEAKTHVNVSGYKEQVYLCADSSALIEVFAITAKKFTVLPLQPLPGNYHRAVIWDDQLIVMNTGNVQRWNMNSLEYIGESRITVPLYTKCAMVINSVLFILQNGECTSLNLETMSPGPKYLIRR